MAQNNAWYLKIQRIPKPVIYVVLVALLVLPLFKPLGLPLAFSANTKKAYDLVDALNPGEFVFHSAYIMPAVDAELWPQMVALTRHYMEKGAKIIYWGTSQEAVMYFKRVQDDIAPEFGYEYGVDFVAMPFKAGAESAVLALKDFFSVFPTDAFGNQVKSLPIFKDFAGIEDVDLFLVNTGGDDITYFVRHIEPIKHTPLVVAGTAPVLPYAAPYLGSGQIKGAIIGTAGAAEYESLAGLPGTATGAMDAQQLGHVLIVLMVIMGNLGYLFQRKSASAHGIRSDKRG